MTSVDDKEYKIFLMMEELRLKEEEERKAKLEKEILMKKIEEEKALEIEAKRRYEENKITKAFDNEDWNTIFEYLLNKVKNSNNTTQSQQQNHCFIPGLLHLTQPDVNKNLNSNIINQINSVNNDKFINEIKNQNLVNLQGLNGLLNSINNLNLEKYEKDIINNLIGKIKVIIDKNDEIEIKNYQEKAIELLVLTIKIKDLVSKTFTSYYSTSKFEDDEIYSYENFNKYQKELLNTIEEYKINIKEIKYPTNCRYNRRNGYYRMIDYFNDNFLNEHCIFHGAGMRVFGITPLQPYKVSIRHLLTESQPIIKTKLNYIPRLNGYCKDAPEWCFSTENLNQMIKDIEKFINDNFLPEYKEQYDTMKKEYEDLNNKIVKDFHDRNLNEAMNNYFNEFITNGALRNGSLNIKGRHHIYDYFHNEKFEKMFWEYIDKNNGYSKCPFCNKTPTVNRMIQHPNDKNYIMRFNGLFKFHTYWTGGGHNTYSGLIESLTCCDYFYDFPNKKSYVLASKFEGPNPKKVKFYNEEILTKLNPNLKNIIKFNNVEYDIEYVEYNPEDPYGIKAKKEHDIITTQNKIEELKRQLIEEENKLKGFTKISPYSDIDSIKIGGYP